jgi:DNA-binding HxlR family transcriptional regulator
VPSAATTPDPEPAGLIRVLAGRWTLPLVTQLSNGGRRYQDLYDALDGISYKVLTETLRRAERDGLVARHLDGERIETATLYELTDLGRSLDVPLAAMGEWVDATGRRWKRLVAAGTGCDGRAGEGTFAPAHRGTVSHFGVCRLSLKCRFSWCIGGNRWRYGP